MMTKAPSEEYKIIDLEKYKKEIEPLELRCKQLEKENQQLLFEIDSKRNIVELMDLTFVPVEYRNRAKLIIGEIGIHGLNISDEGLRIIKSQIEGILNHREKVTENKFTKMYLQVSQENLALKMKMAGLKNKIPKFIKWLFKIEI